MNDSTEWITRREAAAIMGVKIRTVDYHVRVGHLTKHVDGLGRVRLRRSQVESLITPVPAVVSPDR